MADVTGLLDQIAEHAAAVAASASDATATDTRDAAPIGEEGGGATRDSVAVHLVSLGPMAVEYEIVATTPQALWTDEGTKAHRIEPTQAHGLLGPIRAKVGATYFVRGGVDHPGNPAQNWFTQPMQERWDRNCQAVA